MNIPVNAFDVGGPASQILIMLFIAFCLGTAFGYLLHEPTIRRRKNLLALPPGPVTNDPKNTEEPLFTSSSELISNR